MSQDGLRGRHRARCSGAENVKAVTRRGLSYRALAPDPGPRELRRQSTRRLTDLLTRPVGTGETTRDTGDAHQGLRRVGETRRNAGDGGDARRMAHNPSVEGSNPSPATKAGGAFWNGERAFCMWFVN